MNEVSTFTGPFTPVNYIPCMGFSNYRGIDQVTILIATCTIVASYNLM